MSKTDKAKFEFVLQMISEIESYLLDFKSITTLLSNTMGFNATLMNLLQIGETLNKVDKEILKKWSIFDESRGAYNVRNFIAHDYEGVRKSIIEDILRYHLENLKDKISDILGK